jgi:HAD superfamily hydrolase (TIGR01509 family)
MDSPAFIFDMDGVIVDSNPYHKIALRQFCEQHGYELSERVLQEKIYGRTNKDWIPNLFGSIGEELASRYAREKETLFRALYEPHIHPVAGLIDFLEQLDEWGIHRAIATSAPRENVDFTLEKTGTGRYFEMILDESFVTRGKPDPEIYLKTAEALRLPPGRCIVIEDSISGVQAGQSAGCKVIGITTTHGRDELNNVDLIVDDFRGLNVRTVISSLF